MCGRHGEPSPTLTVITSRGKHLYYRTTVEINNSAGRIGPGIDVRGVGGYTIAPPSVHPSGHIYTIDKSAGADIVPALQWIIDLALPDNDPNDIEILPPVPRAWKDKPTSLIKKLDGIVSVVETAREGERNAILFWSSCRFGEMIGDGTISKSLALDLLLDAASRTGLPASEARKTIESGLRYGR
jgi:Bifunctional DNA primase/polymerase, N-terminal